MIIILVMLKEQAPSDTQHNTCMANSMLIVGTKARTDRQTVFEETCVFVNLLVLRTYTMDSQYWDTDK